MSANAGSGKTFVLPRRVIRLLLAGTDPGRILCLTFTKAAAAEMAKRVFDILADWTTLSDAELAAAIAEIEGRRPEKATLAAARRLFARALETPGGLKIQTIHAFCERLLHQFPFEANVAGHFEVLDERDAEALAVLARKSALALAARDTRGPLGKRARDALASASDFMDERAMKELIDDRDRVRRWLVQYDLLDDALADLQRALGLAGGEDVDGLRAAIIADCPFQARPRRTADRDSASGNGTDQQAAERLAPVVDAASRRRPDRRLSRFLDQAHRRRPAGRADHRHQRGEDTTGPASPRCWRLNATVSPCSSSASARPSATSRPPPCCASPTRRSPNTSG